jgi:hypothetical protein
MKIKLQLNIPTYNRPDSLRKIINSIIAQNIPNELEVYVVILDNSNEINKIENLKIYSQFKNCRINIDYIDNGFNIGILNNIKKAYTYFTNDNVDYVWVMGDDDLFIGNCAFLEVCSILKEKKDYIFLNYSNISEDYQTLNRRSFIINTDKKMYTNRKIFEEVLLEAGWLGSNIFNAKSTGIRSKMNNYNSWFPHIELILDLLGDEKFIYELIEFKDHIANRWSSLNTTTWSSNFLQVQISFVNNCISMGRSNHIDYEKVGKDFLVRMGVKNVFSLFKYRNNCYLKQQELIALTKIFNPFAIPIILFYNFFYLRIYK